MYSSQRYHSDLLKAVKPVQKSAAVFGKSLSKLDLFKICMPCLVMVAQLVWFFYQFAFFTGRRLLNF